MAQRDMESHEKRKLLAVVFTDIEGFSALTQQDQQIALQTVEHYRQVVTEYTKSYRGEVIHFYGDGSLSVHASTVDAVQCAIAMQRAFSGDHQVHVRIGIHLGEVVITGETVYGNAVNIASRLQHIASPHSILISGTVATELENHPDIDIVFIGEENVKNIQASIQVYAVKHPALVIPLKREIHDRSATRKKRSYLIAGLVLLIAAVYVVANVFDLWPRRLLDEQILVLPFENRTGDSSFQDFSIYAAAYLSRLMEEQEEIKIVSAREILEHPRISSLANLSYSSISMKTNAHNFIEGYYTLQNDSTLLVISALVDGNSGNYLEHFDDQTIDPDRPNSGLVQLAQNIVGFLVSADFQPLSTPTREAFNAYIEALRLYGLNNYADSRRLLREAIRYDSTFLDAYFALSDTYHNTGDYTTADSILTRIRERFPIASLGSRERNVFHFYEAFNAGNHPAAYKYLLNEYNENPENLFRNTTAAVFSLFYVNAPRKTIKILRKIPFESIDYELPDPRLRITVGIQAYYALGKYKRAYRLAELYPTQDITLRQHKMRIRAYVGVGDTAAIHKELAQIKLNFKTRYYIEALYWTTQQFFLLENRELNQEYLNKAYDVIVRNESNNPERSKVLYDMGKHREGLDHALFLFDFAPQYLPYASLVGRGYALAGMQDSARYYCDKLDSLRPSEHYKGQASYLQACVYTALGDHQSALIKLRNAVDEGLIFYEYNAAFDPRLMPLFDLPEFEEIIHPL